MVFRKFSEVLGLQSGRHATVAKPFQLPIYARKELSLAGDELNSHVPEYNEQKKEMGHQNVFGILGEEHFGRSVSEVNVS